MPLGQRSELWKVEEDPGEAQGLVEAQLSGAGEEEPPSPPSSSSSSSSSSSPSSSCSVLFLIPLGEGSATGSLSRPQSPHSASPFPTAQAARACSQPDQGSSSSDEEGTSPWEEPEVTQPCLQDKLHVKVAALVVFLLLKYCNKQPTCQAEMLGIVSRDYQGDFPVILGKQASKCMRLVFGVDVKEVDPSDHSYVLVTVLGLTCGGMLSGEPGMPKTSLLVLLLGVILLEDDCAPEGEVWEVLGATGVYAGKEHIICGEPRELLTKVWVQEGYVEYRQVPGSDPARYEFPWGPRAHTETSKLQVLEYLLRVNLRQPGSSLILSEGAVSDEGEGARVPVVARAFPGFGGVGSVSCGVLGMK
ncbi:LOW QUALITY PROTEIN: melanoma-associated antigen 9-like [Zalophus californianus]|uniref:LOW QUALITY PROTEIN: melanoma-associated antigen 9-like n=1 Tax=Zalophus californianus TaxID=9704 RepID=A0A6P9F866_ZALCA|nr:LOW QUALITY PROTEIN: melanoma-associated antigen 9-like [Zalophus californianus]